MTLETTDKLVTFLLDNRTFALPLSSVIGFVRAVAVEELPGAPDSITGLINYSGDVIPVVNLRKIFSLEEIEILPEHYFLLVDTGTRSVALHVNHPGEVLESDDYQIREADELMVASLPIKGAVILIGNLTLIPDIERLLSSEEEQQLIAALESSHVNQP